MTESKEAPSGILAALLGGNSWELRHYPNHKQHMHALGVIAANYNDLEGEFYRLFYVTSDKFNVAKLIFSKLNNAERMEVALKVAQTEPALFRPLFEYFVSGFGIAAENRNILMHSKAHNAWSYEPGATTHLTLAKQIKSKPDENNFVQLEVKDLQNIADDLANLSKFGWELFLWRLALFTGGTITWADGKQTTPPLPEKPSPPRKLSLSPLEVQTTFPPPPESSQA